MTTPDQREREVFLLETLLSGLDAREGAKRTGSTMLVYLADMLVQRTREELEAIKPAHIRAGRAAARHPAEPPPDPTRTPPDLAKPPRR